MERAIKTDVMQTADRGSYAERFRAKATDSFAAAQDCLERGWYRSACNRAWYATYQIVIAGAYANLDESPGQEKSNWRHNESERLLSDILKKYGRRLQDGYLVDYLAFLRQWRTVADYEFERDEYVSEDKARRCLELSKRVLNTVSEVSGWSPHLTSNKN